MINFFLEEVKFIFPQVAVKIIDMNNIKDDYVRRNLFREARLLRRLSHPNIIKLFETIKVSYILDTFLQIVTFY